MTHIAHIFVLLFIHMCICTYAYIHVYKYAHVHIHLFICLKIDLVWILSFQHIFTRRFFLFINPNNWFIFIDIWTGIPMSTFMKKKTTTKSLNYSPIPQISKTSQTSGLHGSTSKAATPNPTTYNSKPITPMKTEEEIEIEAIYKVKITFMIDLCLSIFAQFFDTRQQD